MKYIEFKNGQIKGEKKGGCLETLNGVVEQSQLS